MLGRSWLASPKVVLGILLGVLMSIPTLWLGFFMDDYMHLSLMEDWYGLDATPWNLYSYFLEFPIHPWWLSDHAQVSFARPLSSSLLWLDHTLFERGAFFYHLHSVLWLTALLMVCATLYRRILPARLAILALVIYSLDECHALTTGWIANRHSMVSMVPALLGLVAHLKWREEGWRWGLPLSLVGYGIGFLGGETTLSMLAYVLAYELFGAPGDLRRRLLSVVPASALAVGYVLWYKAAGYGATGLGFYLDPTGEPTRFLLGAAQRIPALFAAALAGIPADLWLFAPEFHSLQISIGAIAAILIGILFHRARRQADPELRRSLRWILAGTLFSFLPIAAALPSDRLLMAPMVGGSIILAFVLETAWRKAKSGEKNRGPFQVAAVLLGSILFILTPILRLSGPWMIAGKWHDLEEIARGIDADPSQDIVVALAPDVFSATYIPMILRFEGLPQPKSWSVLSLAPYDHKIEHPAENQLNLQIVDQAGAFLGSTNERFLRAAEDTLHPGEEISTRAFMVEILEVGLRGPTRIAFHFDRSLQDPTLRLMTWKHQSFEDYPAPRIGTTEILENPGLQPRRNLP